MHFLGKMRFVEILLLFAVLINDSLIDPSIQGGCFSSGHHHHRITNFSTHGSERLASQDDEREVQIESQSQNSESPQFEFVSRHPFHPALYPPSPVALNEPLHAHVILPSEPPYQSDFVQSLFDSQLHWPATQQSSDSRPQSRGTSPVHQYHLGFGVGESSHHLPLSSSEEEGTPHRTPTRDSSHASSALSETESLRQGSSRGRTSSRSGSTAQVPRGSTRQRPPTYPRGRPPPPPAIAIPSPQPGSLPSPQTGQGSSRSGTPHSARSSSNSNHGGQLTRSNSTLSTNSIPPYPSAYEDHFEARVIGANPPTPRKR